VSTEQNGPPDPTTEEEDPIIEKEIKDLDIGMTQATRNNIPEGKACTGSRMTKHTSS